jgi:hypothetical protein
MGTPAAVKVGPGLLYVAPIGTTEPTTGSGAMPSAWTAIGYTDNGSMFTSETTFEDIEVEEELDPIRTTATKRKTTIDFEMAEINATHLSVAFNGGSIGSPSSGFVTFEPPALGTENRLMLVWQSDDHQEQLLLRRVVQAGSVGMPRRKAPDKTVIPVSFRVEKPLDGSAAFKFWQPSSLSYSDVH